MLELALFVFGLVGLGLAGYLDLKTTEFPGWIPYGIIAASLIVLTVDGFVANNFSLLINSVFQGLLFLAIGLVLYFSRQWGDGDAWLLGSLGFLLPTRIIFPTQTTILPFYLAVFFNFLIVCLIYIVVYSLFVGLKNNKVRKLFFSELKRGYVYKVISVIAFSALCVGFYFYTIYTTNSFVASYLLALPAIFVLLIVLGDYARLIETHIFRKRVLSKKLKPGDVILDGRWKGLTKEDIKKIRKRYVIVKEGVRLAPVFLITFLVTVFFGSLFWFV